MDNQARTPSSLASPRAFAPPTQIVFIEANVPDAQGLLLLGVQPGVEAALDLSPDGVQQIATNLASHDNQSLASIDTGAKGAIPPGTAMLRSATLNNATIDMVRYRVAARTAISRETITWAAAALKQPTEKAAACGEIRDPAVGTVSRGPAGRAGLADSLGPAVEYHAARGASRLTCDSTIAHARNDAGIGANAVIRSGSTGSTSTWAATAALHAGSTP